MPVRRIKPIYLIITIALVLVVFATFEGRARKFKDRGSMCRQFVQDYLENIKEFENIKDYGSDKWKAAIWVETDIYNLCMSNLAEEDLGSFESRVTKEYKETQD